MSDRNGLPLVSVLMTAYNREAFIGEAIESVLASSYSQFELIIVDDCSQDSTLKIAMQYEKDKRVKVFQNSKNLGQFQNRNKAGTYASGKYIKYVDSDDKLLPGGLAYCVDVMEKFPKADWGVVYAQELEKEFVLEANQSIKRHFFETPFLLLGPGGVIIKRAFFNRIGMFPTTYGPANDMYFNLAAASCGNTLLMNNRFLFYRRHDGQELNNQFSYLYNNYRYLRDALQNLNLQLTENERRWLTLKMKRRFAVNILKHLLAEKDISKTRLAIKKAEFSAMDFMEGLLHMHFSAYT